MRSKIHLKVSKNKATGINGVPPNTFKALNDKISPGFYYSTINYGVAKLISTNFMKAK